jgi:hypothetical protein
MGSVAQGRGIPPSIADPSRPRTSGAGCGPEVMPGTPRPYDGTPPSVHRPPSHRHHSFLSPFVVVPISAFTILRDAGAYPPGSGREILASDGDRAGQPRPSRTQGDLEGKDPFLPGARRAPLPGTPQRPGRECTSVGRPRRDVAVQRLYRGRRSARDDRRSAARRRRSPRASGMRSSA